MLKIYLSSVIVFMIIINCTFLFFKDEILKKLKLAKVNTKPSNLFESISCLFVMSAIPIIRLIITIFFIHIGTCSQENFDRIYKNELDKEY